MNRLTLTFLALSGFASASDVALDEREWKLLTSENFRVHTVLSDERTTELLRQLEVMRVALGNPNATATFQAAVPTVILALDNDADYQLIGAPDTTVGFFISDQRENAIVVQVNDQVHGVRTILHEYVHYLHRQNGRVTYPKWFEEGNAEYLSSSRVSEESYDYGLPIVSRLQSLTFASWLPMTDVLELSDLSSLTIDQGDLFYSQSWLLVHYLNSLPNADASIPKNIRRYGELVVGGSSRVTAFEQAFSLKVDDLDDKLLKYLLANDFQFRSIAIDTALPDFSPRIETLSTSEVQLALAEMAMRFLNDKEAEQWFTKALSDDVTRPRAESGLGTVYGYRGDISKASERFEAAIYLVSYDFRMWMDYAQFWADRISVTDDIIQRESYGKRLEESLRNALTISDATPELNALMGFAYMAQGKDIDEAIEFLIAATEQSPTDQPSRLLLASAYLFAKRFHLAISTAESVLRFEHESNEITAAADEIIRMSGEMLDRQQ
jgi:tetratricopeptide (TPR) repeat protein